jgi:hypothetical protein
VSDLSVNDVSPPQCERCNRPLTTTEELNRRIDWAVDMCTACLEIEEADSCWCTYGWFIEGDPRQFQPDEENSEGEIAAWRAACAAWERGEYVNPAVEEHGPWVEAGTGRVTLGERPSTTAIGVCSAPRAYGQGALNCDQHKAPADAWKSWPIRRADLSGGAS